MKLDIVQVLDDDEKPSAPCDMWALGAVLSFFCNRRDPFMNIGQVARWKGGTGGLFKDEDLERYGDVLRNLTAALLNPIPDLRPTAEKVVEKSQIFLEKFGKFWYKIPPFPKTSWNECNLRASKLQYCTVTFLRFKSLQSCFYRE